MSASPLIVIGAGASGLMAAGRAAELGARVLLLEKTGHPANKLLITGNTRCNLTNSKELDDFVTMYGANGRFLYGAFRRYFRDDLLAFLRRYGTETKAEFGGRIFPASGDARGVVNALQRYLADGGAHLETGVRVIRIMVDEGHVVGVQTADKAYPAAAVVLATGGSSYPSTGSTGDGYRMAAALGHTITRLRPALVPLAVFEADSVRQMQGVGLGGVRLTAYRRTSDEIDDSDAPAVDVGRGIPGKRPRPPVIESRCGDLLLTHFGVSGPVTLQMSLAVVDALEHGPVSIAIDIKPGLSKPELNAELQASLDRSGRRGLPNILDGLLPRKLVKPILDISGVSADKRGHQVTADERERLVNTIKSLRFNVKSPLPLAEAMVTAGGVSVKEINPRTMGSRLVAGLFFCGEVIDIDGDTGGYNLQAAFSTGYVAGESAAAYASGRKWTPRPAPAG